MITKGMAIVASVGVLGLLGGCATSANLAEHARMQAAEDHGCSVEQVKMAPQSVSADVHTGYWFDVCGSERFYKRAKIPTDRKLGGIEMQKLVWTFTDQTPYR